MHSHHRSFPYLLLCLILSAPLVADEGHDHGPVAGEKLGTVRFQTSCAPSVRQEFERGVALNWFLNKHNLKLQSDFRQIESEITETTLDEYRLQAQWIF